MREMNTWWDDVLGRDEIGRKSGESYEDAFMRRLRCVFCEREFTDVALFRRPRHHPAMVAMWLRRDTSVVWASGMYCLGVDGCYPAAKAIGRLGDFYADECIGPKAQDACTMRSLDYRWEPDALRRFVVVCGGLALLGRSRA